MHAITGLGRAVGTAIGASRDEFQNDSTGELLRWEEGPTISLHRTRLSSPLKRALAFLVCSLACGGATTTVHAVPLYNAYIPGIEQVTASPTAVFLSNTTDRIDRASDNAVIGEATHSEIAAASYGQVRGSSNADYLNVHPSFPIFSGAGTGAQESSGFALDDLVITGPPGNILVSFNYTISGSIGAEIVATGNPAFYSASASVQAGGGIGAHFGAGGFGIGQMFADGGGNVSRSGIFATFPVNSGGTAMGTSPETLTFAGDTELGFSLGLETGAGAGVGGGGEPGSANAHASFTFGFPTSGPVANLPEGYTLNSVSGQIVDNRFVPEPGSAALLTLGGIGMLVRRRCDIAYRAECG